MKRARGKKKKETRNENVEEKVHGKNVSFQRHMFRIFLFRIHFEGESSMR